MRAFHAGMAAALCGDQPYAEKTIAALQQNYPQNTAVAQYYVPELQAAAEIGVNEPEKALDSLIALEPYDSISLTPYLRGMANAALGQTSRCGCRFPDGAGSSRIGIAVGRRMPIRWQRWVWRVRMRLNRDKS